MRIVDMIFLKAMVFGTYYGPKYLSYKKIITWTHLHF
jgi:hypothetical protein